MGKAPSSGRLWGVGGVKGVPSLEFHLAWLLCKTPGDNHSPANRDWKFGKRGGPRPCLLVVGEEWESKKRGPHPLGQHWLIFAALYLNACIKLSLSAQAKPYLLLATPLGRR